MPGCQVVTWLAPWHLRISTVPSDRRKLRATCHSTWTFINSISLHTTIDLIWMQSWPSGIYPSLAKNASYRDEEAYLHLQDRCTLTCLRQQWCEYGGSLCKALYTCNTSRSGIALALHRQLKYLYTYYFKDHWNCITKAISVYEQSWKAVPSPETPTADRRKVAAMYFNWAHSLEHGLQCQGLRTESSKVFDVQSMIVPTQLCASATWRIV